MTTQSPRAFLDDRRLTPILIMQLLLLPALMPSLGWIIPALTLVITALRVLPRFSTGVPSRLSRSWMNTLVTVSFVIWWLAFPSKVTLEPAVALLMLGASLKLNEVEQPRDAYVLVYTYIALAASVFLFDQSLWTSVTVLATLIMALLALVEINTPDEHKVSFIRRLALPSTLLIVAVPMTLIWFLIFPRIAPLWAIPVLGESVKMGMSDTLRPGDVANLGQDASVAFRAEFSGDLPPFTQLYWRGITLGKFQNGVWQQHSYLKRPRSGRFARAFYETAPSETSANNEYTVFQAASQRSWLYHLEPSIPLNDFVAVLPDNTLQTPWPITSDLETRYRLLSQGPSPSQFLTYPELEAMLLQETEFPRDLNPKAAALAERLKVRGNPEASVLRSLEWFRSEPFTYTLQPQLITENDFVDRFLFDTQSGFCEHFAYSFVALMRLMGIPARIVGGYMGGEINPLNGTVTVRELDAHAWAEVWVEGRGWIRVDPTATVAPDRIERGSLDSLQGTAGFLNGSPLSLLHLRNWEWVNRMRLELDAIDYRWQASVMSYKQSQQSQLLVRILGHITTTRILLLLAMGVAVTLIPIALFLASRHFTRWRQPKFRVYRALQRTLKNQGVEVGSGETFRQAVNRALSLPNANEERLKAQLQSLERVWYGAGS